MNNFKYSFKEFKNSIFFKILIIVQLIISLVLLYRVIEIKNYEKGKVISGLENLDSDIVVFHSGTKFDNENIVTNGGRVIGITAKSKTVKEAAQKVYENIKKINFEKMHYRKDIWK